MVKYRQLKCAVAKSPPRRQECYSGLFWCWIIFTFVAGRNHESAYIVCFR